MAKGSLGQRSARRDTCSGYTLHCMDAAFGQLGQRSDLLPCTVQTPWCGGSLRWMVTQIGVLPEVAGALVEAARCEEDDVVVVGPLGDLRSDLRRRGRRRRRHGRCCWTLRSFIINRLCTNGACGRSSRKRRIAVEATRGRNAHQKGCEAPAFRRIWIATETTANRVAVSWRQATILRIFALRKACVLFPHLQPPCEHPSDGRSVSVAM